MASWQSASASRSSLCWFFVSALTFRYPGIAGSLKKYRGEIAGAAPGKETGDYVDHVLSRTTMLGACYLALVCLVPELLIGFAQVPFYFGGTSLLVVVCAMLDLEDNFRALR